MTTITDLYKIENGIRLLTDAEKDIFFGLYDAKYSSFFLTNESLKKEIGIGKLMQLFSQFIKKNITLSKQNSSIVRKYLKMARVTKTQLPILISQEYQHLKHLTSININTTTDQKIKIVMLKIMSLFEKEMVAPMNVFDNIEFVKSVSSMVDENSEIEEILDMVKRKKKYKLPGGKVVGEETLNKKLTTRTKNKIYNKILKKKLQIFKDDDDDDEEKIEEGIFDEQLMRILAKRNQDDKLHVYQSIKITKQLIEYFDFIFKLKSRTNKLDNILQSSIFCLFDEHHIHINFMLEQEDSFTFPFRYEDNDTIYIVETTFISYLAELKNYKHIREIVKYFIDYLIKNEYDSKFLEHETPCYFAQLKGFLRMINYTDQMDEQKQMFRVFKKNDKNQKSTSKKLKYIRTIKYKKFDKDTNQDVELGTYDQLINIDMNSIKNISLGNKNDKGENLKILLDILVIADMIKLSIFMRDRFPRTWKRKKNVMEKSNIYTYKQFLESKLLKIYQRTKKEPKKEIIKMRKFNIFEFTHLPALPALPIEKEKYKNKLERMQMRLELIQFKMQYGLITDNEIVLKEEYEKMVYQLDDNNRNNILITNIETNLKLLNVLFSKATNSEEKSKINRQIQKLNQQQNIYQNNIKNVDQNGFAYGVNFEEPNYASPGFVTSEVINFSNKIKETMKVVDAIFKKKKVNNRLNMFKINLLNNFEYVQSQLYDLFSLYINHKMDIIFENYLMKTKINIKTDLLTISNDRKNQKKLGNDFSRLLMIIFFILKNEQDIEKFYTLITKKSVYSFENKFVTYNDKIGKVIEQKDNDLFIRFENLEIEKVDKELVKIVTNLERRNVRIIRGIYKGWVCMVYKQIGNQVHMTLDTYGLNNSTNTKCNVTKLVMSIDDIKILPNNIIDQSESIAIPKHVNNRDLYSISRFLFQQITDNGLAEKNNNDMMYFNAMYEITLKHVNEIIYINQSRKNELQELKKNKDKKFEKMKKYYEGEGLVTIDLSETSFRTTEKDLICILKDNSTNYQNEEDDDFRFNDIKPTPEEQKEKDDRQKEEFINKYKFMMTNFVQTLENINLF